MNELNENPLRYWREKLGKTQRQLAQEAGTTQPTLSNIENGKRKGTRYNLKKYATALGIPYSELASLEETDRAERGHKGGSTTAARRQGAKNDDGANDDTQSSLLMLVPALPILA